MNARDVLRLIDTAVLAEEGTWADLGAGEGVFTRALLERIGPRGIVYAVDRDARTLDTLLRRAESESHRVIPVVADLGTEFELPGRRGPLDGMLFANTLHFIEDAAAALTRMTAWLRPGGRAVFVEYDRRQSSRWVPFPITPSRLGELTAGAGLSLPTVTATRPSAYGGDLYVAVSERRRNLLET